MCHALVIEDEPLIAFHIGDVVEEAGGKHRRLFQTKLEAISAAMEHRPDIIVADVNLRSGTGPEAATDHAIERFA